MGKLIDLTGQRFGRLTVLEKYPKPAKSGSQWICQCQCSKKAIVTRCNLISGNTRSCGCDSARLMNETKKARGYIKDLTGKRYGNLLVVEKSEIRRGTNPVWNCLCDCGNMTLVIQENLLNGHTKSCGCKSSRSTMGDRARTHGMSHERLYNVWRSMKTRCENPNTESYPYYGARGIKVCEEWNQGFEAFYNWAMENGYDPQAPFGRCTIDRINVDGNYEPSNCRWVDFKVQANNKTRHKYGK